MNLIQYTQIPDKQLARIKTLLLKSYIKKVLNLIISIFTEYKKNFLINFIIFKNKLLNYKIRDSIEVNNLDYYNSIIIFILIFVSNKLLNIKSTYYIK